MEITVNHQIYPVAGPCSIAQLLSAVLQVSGSGIAVAVNQAIVSKSEWSDHLLKQGDQVILIKATQGG